MVAFFSVGPLSLLWSQGEFLFGVNAGLDCTAAHVHRLKHSREKDAPKLRDGNFDPSLLAPASHMGW